MADAAGLDQRLLLRLKTNIHAICSRVVHGKSARKNASVWQQPALAIASVILSSVGSAGIIANRMSPTNSSKPLWYSLAALVISVLSQIASLFEVSKRASSSRALAERCGVFHTRLESMLNSNDPQIEVSQLMEEINKLFASPEYNVVLPAQTKEMKAEAAGMAEELIDKNVGLWVLKAPRGR